MIERSDQVEMGRMYVLVRSLLCRDPAWLHMFHGDLSCGESIIVLDRLSKFRNDPSCWPHALTPYYQSPIKSINKDWGLLGDFTILVRGQIIQAQLRSEGIKPL